MHQRRVACRHPPLRAACAALWLSAWLEAGCTEPRFAGDAGDADMESPETDADVDSVTRGAIDPRWEPWIGRYAARTILYATDGLVRPTSEEFSLVVIEPRGERLVLEQTLCFYEGKWSFVLDANVRYRYPDGVTLRAEITPSERNFETELARLHFGFDPEPPTGCVPGGSAASDQPWLSGSCSCPRQPDKIPVNESDCRVIDIDGDGEPGVTFEAALSGTRLRYYAAQEVSVRYRNGYRIDDRLYANVEGSASTVVFGCSMPEISANCAIGAATLCDTEFNKVVFVPLLGDDYDCARIVAQRDGLFPEPIPPFPSACAAAP